VVLLATRVTTPAGRLLYCSIVYQRITSALLNTLTPATMHCTRLQQLQSDHQDSAQRRHRQATQRKVKHNAT